MLYLGVSMQISLYLCTLHHVRTIQIRYLEGVLCEHVLKKVKRVTLIKLKK